MDAVTAERPKPKKDGTSKPASRRAVRIAEANLRKQERAFLEGLQRPRPKRWIDRLTLNWREASQRLHRDEFDFICKRITDYLDGKAMDPAAAKDLARRLFEAYTDVECLTACPTCSETWLAILIIDVRRFGRGFYWTRSFQLVDPEKTGR